ncbi:MAG: histone deacetylase [Silvanigrellales bacterium]|nr:histone deacetylase [Silvanigrellales bacterium]
MNGVASAWYPLFSCEDFPLHLPEGHPFPHGKYSALEALLREAGFAGNLTRVGTASREKLELVHHEDYLNRVFGGCLTAEETRRLGFPWGPSYLNRALASVEATWQCALTVLAGKARVAGALAGGTHHAFADRGEGYCTFNDIAIASRYALSTSVDRVFVADLDAHQGNGTASVFAREPRVFTFSMHCEENYPRTKEKSSLDVGLPRGTGDDAYMEALEAYLPEALAYFSPELVFFQAGVDVLAVDRFGRLGLTLEGLRKRDVFVCDAVLSRGIPLVLTLGGGYQRDAAAVGRAHAQTYLTAAKVLARFV